MTGSINTIESFGLVDGPGIRAVIFLNGCMLRCKFCHNPEMWKKSDNNYTALELRDKIDRFKPYFGKNGGVTFSGGEPLLQADFLIEAMKLLKEDNINIALDTAGVGIGKYEEILENTDLIIFDVKHTSPEGYKNLVGIEMDEVNNFLKVANKMDKKFWIRQVVVPGYTDSLEYIKSLSNYIKEKIKIENIEKIEFLPYHTMAIDKYNKLGINYPLEGVPAMDKEECNKLYDEFLKIYKED